MNVFVTGATGFIGRALVLKLVAQGHRVAAWVRDPVRARAVLGADVELVSASRDDRALKSALEGSDAVVNLAGEPIVGGRWTQARRAELVSSRVDLTKRIAAAIGAVRGGPSVMVSASAVGFYGDRGDEVVNEASTQGEGFLADLCARWEGAADRATEHGVRVVKIRIGVVLGREGGALAKMLPPFRAGAGGRIGSGKQYMPWIHQLDLVDMMATALQNERYHGVINGTAPNPVTNAELTRALGRAVGRPTIFPVPATVLRIAMGEASDVLITGQRAVPTRAEELGFGFRFPTLPEALEDIEVDDKGVRFRAASDQPESAYLKKRRAAHVLEQQMRIETPIETVFDFFSQAANLGVMTPPSLSFEIASDVPRTMEEGTSIEYRIGLGPIPMKWRTRIEAWRPGERFVDVQEAGPYATWWHEHRFEADGERATIMTDRVYYRVPFGVFGRIAHALFVRPMLRRIFAFRAQATALRFAEDEDRPTIRAA